MCNGHITILAYDNFKKRIEIIKLLKQDEDIGNEFYDHYATR